MKIKTKSRKTLIIGVLIVVSLILCAGCVVASYFVLNKFRNREGESDEESQGEDQEEDTQEEEEQDESDLYPKLEKLIGQSLEDIKAKYPNGKDIDAKTAWGTIYHSYEYETDLFILTVDGKETGVIDGTSLVVKKFTGCKMDETIVDIVEELVPYAGFDPQEIGPVNDFGVPGGVATFFEYKEGYVLSISCTFTLANESYYLVNYFKNPNL